MSQDVYKRQAYIWELIDVRKSNGRPTIITSNYDSDELYERLSEAGNGNDVLAIIDRLAQSNVIAVSYTHLQSRVLQP